MRVSNHRLILLRHGKSDWYAAYQDDHDRPLAPRGRRAARRMGRLLSGKHAPTLVITSSAKRAHDTVRLATEAAGWQAPVRVTRRLYDASVDTVIALLQELDDDTAPVVLIAGHEPTSSALVSALIGGGSVRMPTAAVAAVDLDIAHWQDLRPGVGVLRWLVTPKLIA